MYVQGYKKCHFLIHMVGTQDFRKTYKSVQNLNSSSGVQTNNFNTLIKKSILTFFITFKIVTKSFINEIISHNLIFILKNQLILPLRNIGLKIWDEDLFIYILILQIHTW